MQPCENCPDNTVPYVIQDGDSVPQIENYVADQLNVDLETLRELSWPRGLSNHVIWMDWNCAELGTLNLNFMSNAGRTICIPIDLNRLSEAEEERARQGALELVQDREADRSRQPPAIESVTPVTQEQVDRLLANIATAEHYQHLLNTVANDPTALLADSLLLLGQELSEEATANAHKVWLLRYMRDHRGWTDWRDYTHLTDEEIEAEVKQDLILRIEEIAGSICNTMGESQEGRPSWCDREIDYWSMGIEALVQELAFVSNEHRSIFNPGAGLPMANENLAIASSYYDTIDKAQIEIILEEWDQEGERALLDELLAATSDIPATILAVDVGFVKTGVMDYYGEMEARHQMLAEIVRPRQEQAALDQEHDAAARELYLNIIWENTGDGVIGSEWLNASTEELYREAHRISVANGNQAMHEFILGKDEAYGIDSYANLHALLGAARVTLETSAWLILAFDPVFGSAMDIVDGLRALARGDVLGVTLSLLGPLGDAVRMMRGLFSAGEAAAGTLRALDTIDDLEDGPLKSLLRQGRDAADPNVRNLGRATDDLDGAVDDLARSGGNSGGNPIENRYESTSPSSNMVNQEWEMSCTAASCRQAFIDLGYDVDEAVFREALPTHPRRGSNPRNIPSAVDQVASDMGISDEIVVGSYGIDNPSIQDVHEIVGDNDIVIVDLRTRRVTSGHTVIITEVNVENGTITVRDPYGDGPKTGQGMEGVLTWKEFIRLWGIDPQNLHWTLNNK